MRNFFSNSPTPHRNHIFYHQDLEILKISWKSCMLLNHVLIVMFEITKEFVI